MGHLLFPVVSNIFMEHFEETALDTVDYKPTKRLRYVNDTFVAWPHGPVRLQQFLHHLNSVRPIIKSNSHWKLKLMTLFHSWMFWL
jgi:hypothetical protein